jgi:hypothetical protein
MDIPKSNSQKDQFFSVIFWHQWVRFWDFEKYGWVDITLFSINISWDRLIANYVEVDLGLIGIKCKVTVKIPWKIEAAEARKKWATDFLANKTPYVQSTKNTDVH